MIARRAMALFCAPLLTGCFAFPASQPPPRTHRPAPPPVAYTDPAFQKGPAELEAMVAKMTEDFEPIGQPVTGRLESFQPLRFDARRGRCYRVVFRLQEPAQFSEHARRGVVFAFRVAGVNVMGGPGIAGPGGVGSAGCPQRSGPASFDLQANWGSALDKSRIHDLGSGGYTVQLYARAISQAKLEAMQANQDRQIEESRRFQRERAAEACRHCARQREECRDGRHRPFTGSCLGEYDSCLRRSSVREGECPY